MSWIWKILLLVLVTKKSNQESTIVVRPPFLSSQDLTEVMGSYKTPGGGFFSYSYTLPVSTIPPPPIPGCDTKESPSCSNGTDVSFCIYDSDYPKYEIKAIKHDWKLSPFALKKESKNLTSLGLVENLSRRREEFIFYSLYTGVSKGPTPYDETHWSGPEGFVCPSSISYARVMRAKNIEGDWRVIVQDERSSTTQTTRLEECLYPEAACRALAPCYKSRCVQKYIHHRLISYDPCDPFKGLFVDIYKLPSACSCHVDHQFLPKIKSVSISKTDQDVSTSNTVNFTPGNTNSVDGAPTKEKYYDYNSPSLIKNLNRFISKDEPLYPPLAYSVPDSPTKSINAIDLLKENNTEDQIIVNVTNVTTPLEENNNEDQMISNVTNVTTLLEENNIEDQMIVNVKIPEETDELMEADFPADYTLGKMELLKLQKTNLNSIDKDVKTAVSTKSDSDAVNKEDIDIPVENNEPVNSKYTSEEEKNTNDLRDVAKIESKERLADKYFEEKEISTEGSFIDVDEEIVTTTEAFVS